MDEIPSQKTIEETIEIAGLRALVQLRKTKDLDCAIEAFYEQYPGSIARYDAKEEILDMVDQLQALASQKIVLPNDPFKISGKSRLIF